MFTPGCTTATRVRSQVGYAAFYVKGRTVYIRDSNQAREYELRRQAAIITAGLDLLIDLSSGGRCDSDGYRRRLQSLEADIEELLNELREVPDNTVAMPAHYARSYGQA
jgi:hypothetical protein